MVQLYIRGVSPLCLTSGWGLGLWCQDNKAKALVVFALQSDVKALWPRGLKGLDSVRDLDARHLGRGVDQGACYMLWLLTALLLPITVWQTTKHRNMFAVTHLEQHFSTGYKILSLWWWFCRLYWLFLKGQGQLRWQMTLQFITLINRTTKVFTLSGDHSDFADTDFNLWTIVHHNLMILR